jgi:hypothetical protein
VFGTNVWNSFDGELYNLEKDKWSSLPSSDVACKESSCALVQDTIYIVARDFGDILQFDTVSLEFKPEPIQLGASSNAWKTVIAKDDTLLIAVGTETTFQYNL